MAAYLGEFIAGLRAAIAAAVPSVLPANGGGSIFEGVHARIIPFAEFPLPYAGINTLDLRRDGGRGVANGTYCGMVELWIVAEVGGDSAAVRALTEPLRDYLRDNPVPGGQLIPADPDFSGEMELIPNKYFADKRVPQRAACLVLHAVAGEAQSLASVKLNPFSGIR